MNNKKINIAVVGATGVVGKDILSLIASRNVPINNVYALASDRSNNKKISFGEDKILTVQNLRDFDFSKADVIISATSSEVTESYSSKALRDCKILIDKSSLFRIRDDVPLVIPEVNGHLIDQLPKSKIIASPNCCVIPLMMVLAPLNLASRIKRVVISTYQSVSGAGKAAMDELYNQTKNSFMYSEKRNDIFEKQISFNVIPKIDQFNEVGETGEEEKIRNESQKILKSQALITATCVRVPVFIGHSLSVNVEFETSLTAAEASEILQEAEGIRVIDKHSKQSYMTPAEVVGEDEVYVSRIRQDPSCVNGLNFWIVSDNLKKGAALNALHILEKIIHLL